MRVLKCFGILGFLERETKALDRRLFVLTAASGTANATNLAVINAAVDSMKQGGPFWYHFVLFGLSIGLFVYSLRYILHESSRIAEEAILGVRTRLADKIRRSDLMALETIGEAEIHARITRDTTAIAQAARPLFSGTQSAIMVIFTMAYIAAVSPVAMLLCLLLIVSGIGLYLRDHDDYQAGLQDSSRCEDGLFSSLTGLLKGFKELRLNQAKSDDVFAEFGVTARQVRDRRLKVMLKFSDNQIFVEMFFLVLLGAVVFVLPLLSTSFSDSVTKIVAAILFFFGPLGNVVMMIPVLSEVNVTVDNLRRLEASLDQALDRCAGQEQVPGTDLSGFQSVQLDGLHFTYRDPEGAPLFQVGPIDGEIRRGEILFLVGGNGSGKTSFMKLFTALYHPDQGSIRVDGQEIGPHNIQSYRNLFSAIFSDFYLFEKLHGLQQAAPEKVAEMLQLMEIAGKTDFQGGRFTHTSLSTGQRKRLALVVSYLEDKSIYIFDEVAADQDPHFRAYFYETLLPDLKRAGKTLVVVSHDDRYFHVADRVLEMDYGRLRTHRRGPRPGAPAKKPTARRSRKSPVPEPGP